MQRARAHFDSTLMHWRSPIVVEGEVKFLNSFQHAALNNCRCRCLLVLQLCDRGDGIMLMPVPLKTSKQLKPFNPRDLITAPFLPFRPLQVLLDVTVKFSLFLVAICRACR